jgi:4-amino-4-deoxy-L-arabinose transferase-like glycosyltransferase
MKSKLLQFFKGYWILILLVFIKLILQYVVVNPVYELHRDEFLHLDQAKHLAFGFISVPPFTSLVSRIIFLFGGDLFWIRFFPALFGALTLVFVWLIVESAGGGLYAKILASAALLFSPLLRINILFQPNSFDILIWTVIFYLLIRFIQSEKPLWLYLTVIIAAIGLYNKYNLVFLMSGLLISMLLTEKRKILGSHSFWKAILLGILLFLPNIIWQIVNHFPAAEHMKVLYRLP